MGTTASSQLRVAERHVGDSLRVQQMEEAVEIGPPQIEVDEHDPAPCARFCDREIRGCRRLPLLPHGARDQDRAHFAFLQACEIEVRAQHAEHLGAGAGRLVEHDEAVLLGEALRRRWDTRQERQAQPLSDLFRRADSRVERVDPEGQAKPEHQAEHEGQNGVFPGA